MTPAQRETLRQTILRHLDASESALGEDLLVQMIKVEGFSALDKTALRMELQYLEDKGMVRPSEKQISPENRRWRITATGRDYRAETEGV